MHNLYAGDVDPSYAWKILEDDEKSILVDVRSLPEWSFVGVPDLSSLGKEVILISWKIYPSMAVNGEFLRQFEKAAQNKDAPVFFICRSGHRSMDAAIFVTRYGYKHCYNVAGGFEGDVDADGHRGNKNGWKLANLPWGQK
jgi:rhodanese-related sulfurtransferase